MRSPDELLGQLIFWGGVASFPIFIGLLVVAISSRTFAQAAVRIFGAMLALNHFVWFVLALGGALGTKVGGFEPPDWWSFLPYTLSLGVLFVLLWYFRSRRRATKDGDAGTMAGE